MQSVSVQRGMSACKVGSLDRTQIGEMINHIELSLCVSQHADLTQRESHFCQNKKSQRCVLFEILKW